MKIAVIGTGNVGGALAKGWAKAGHEVLLGVRDKQDSKVMELASFHEKISIHSVQEAAQTAETILVAAVPQATKNIAETMGNVEGKIIIDAMNSIGKKPEPFSNTFDALKAWTNSADVVKCFNTTGFENMFDPIYDGEGVDMFVAGSSDKGKSVASQLAKDLGFNDCLDFGGDDKAALLEQFALCWINLAIMQGQGRGMAFKVLRR